MKRPSNQALLQMLESEAFGPTGVIDGNLVTAVGQGLKKMFNPQIVSQREWRTDRKKPQKRSQPLSNPFVPPVPIGCCMYPSQGLLDGIYLREDLPETVTAYGQDGAYQVLFTLVLGDGEIIYTGDDSKIVIDYQNYWEPRNVISDSGFQDTSPNPCLIFEPFSPNLAYIGDNFQDTYTVEEYTVPRSGPPETTFTITRTSLCTWEGTNPLTEGTYAVNYQDNANNRNGLWILDTISFGAFRNDGGPYNSPVGTYAESNLEWDVF